MGSSAKSSMIRRSTVHSSVVNASREFVQPALPQLTRHLVGAYEQHLVAMPARYVTERVRVTCVISVSDAFGCQHGVAWREPGMQSRPGIACPT
jgi:hypothetical protein